MAKKEELKGVNEKAQPVAFLEIGEAERALADYLEVDLKAPPVALLSRCKEDSQLSTKAAIRIGLRLMVVKEQCQHGEFDGLMQEAGVGLRDGQQCMRLAKAYAAEGDARRRDALLEMGKTKAVTLLAQRPEVRERLMDSPELLAEALEGTKREFEAQLKSMREQHSDTATQLQTALNQIKALQRPSDRGNGAVPPIVADARAELAALIKKAELAITSLHPVGVEIVGLVAHNEAAEWVKPSLRLGLSGLLAVRELVDGSIKSFVEAMGEDIDRVAQQPDVLAFLDASEIKGVAEDWARLTAVHQHEAALREHERAQARPKGKGRPAKAPEAPKA